MKRESDDIEGGDMDDDDQEDEKGHMLSPIPTGSSQLTASFASAASSQHQHKWRFFAAECSATSAACGGPSAVATLTTVPKTPGNGVCSHLHVCVCVCVCVKRRARAYCVRTENTELASRCLCVC